jgi:RimJ/RimL family protein N-acetyltransferase
MRYAVLNVQEYHNKSYSLVPIREMDMISIMHWRNEQIDILRQKKKLTSREQSKYFHKVIRPLFKTQLPDQILFSFLKGNDCIGYGGLTHINWEALRAEISFLLNPTHTKKPLIYQKEFTIFLNFIKEVAFDDLHLHRVYAETYDIRPNHVKTLKKNKFVLEGRLRENEKINNRYVDTLIHGCLRGSQ